MTAMDLVEFLNARLAEDEAAAKACESPSPWDAAEHEYESWIVTDATGEALIYDEGTPTLNEAAHIARHDPARVLREVEAKRAILAAYESETQPSVYAPEPEVQELIDQRVQVLEDALVDLAAVYRDHPDYRDEWDA